MAGQQDMTMAIRITAAGNQALAVIRSVNGAIKSTSEMGARMGRTIGGTFSFLGKGLSAVLAPARILGGAALGLSLVFGGLSAKAISASGDMEVLRLRLEGVTASAEEARKHFEQASRMAIASPFTPQELVEAKIGLLGIGIAGEQALAAIGDASAITQRQISDVVSMVAAMETEPLRRIGIELKRNAGEYEFTFRDKMMNVRRIVASGVDDARTALLSIFETRFGGGMARFAAAWKGLTSTLQGLLVESAARFGDGLMPVAKRFVDGLNQRLTSLIESGRLTAWGEKVGEIISGAWDRAEAVIGFAADVAANLRQTPGAMGEGLVMVMRTGGQMLAVNFAQYLRGMAGVFVGLARMMSAAFLEDILRLPFMGGARQDLMITAARNDIDGFFAKLSEMGRSKKDFINNNLTQDQQIQLATHGRGDMLESAARSIPDTIRQIAIETAGANAEMLRGLQDGLSALAGGSIEGVGRRVAQVQARRLDAEQAAIAAQARETARKERERKLDDFRMVETMSERRGEGGGVQRTRRQWVAHARHADAAIPGQQTPYGVIINIARLNVDASDPDRMSRALLENSGMPVLAHIAGAGGI